MKEIKRTISVNVNGKKVDIRFFTDSEIIEKINKEGEGALFCRFCKFFDFCNNEELKNPLLLDDSNSSFQDFCISVGIIGKYNYDSRLSLDTVKKEFPELYESAAAYCKEVGDNDISIDDLIVVIHDNTLFGLMPTYEDVEPILEDLKKK